jgi:hypothetical protein
MAVDVSSAAKKQEAYQELVSISRENGKGDNITKEEFASLQKGGHLDGWISEHGFDFGDLDLNNSGRISTTDGSKLKSASETTTFETRSVASTENRSTSNSNDVVVLQFGWSDTSIGHTEDALADAGISPSDYEMSDSGEDKGVGIAVVTREQAEKFQAEYGGSKTFAHIHSAVDGVNDITDLRITFDVSDSKDSIGFGGGAYGALMTDDPANKTSGSNVKSTQTGSDSFWSVSDGDRASAQMYEERGSQNGQQYVRMNAEVR